MYPDRHQAQARLNWGSKHWENPISKLNSINQTHLRGLEGGTHNCRKQLCPQDVNRGRGVANWGKPQFDPQGNNSMSTSKVSNNHHMRGNSIRAKQGPKRVGGIGQQQGQHPPYTKPPIQPNKSRSQHLQQNKTQTSN